MTTRFFAFAPGRVNLIGEYTDFNGGYVLPFAIEPGVSFELTIRGPLVDRSERAYRVVSEQGEARAEFPMDMVRRLAAALDPHDLSDLRPLLPPDIATSWRRYVAGCLAWHVKSGDEHGWSARVPRFVDIHLRSTLPIGAGVSSSAALSTGLLGLLRVSEDMVVDRSRIAWEAMAVEHQFAGTRCGLMDQTAVAQCQAGSLLLIDFSRIGEGIVPPEIMTRVVEPHCHFAPYKPVILNTGVKHDLGSSPYNERRVHCEVGRDTLNRLLSHPGRLLSAYSHDEEFWRRYAPDREQATLKRNLSEEVFASQPIVARRISHVIKENQRVLAAVSALESGDYATLTSAMNASHDSLRDDFEVSCRELDIMRDGALLLAADLGRKAGLDTPAMLGARMTGGGFGGSTVQLVHERIVTQFCEAVTRSDFVYARETGLSPHAVISTFANGLTWGRA